MISFTGKDILPQHYPKKLIHADGPMKKTVIMGNDDAIKIIKKTAKLDLKSIKRVK